MQRFTHIYKQTIIDCWDKEAVANYGTKVSYTYGQFAEKIAELHVIFDIYNIQKGDKISVLGKNSSNWIISFIASVNYGAIIVPILDEFNSRDVINILNHSDTKLFFCDKWFFDKITIAEIPDVLAVFSLNDFSVLDSNSKDDKGLKRIENIKQEFESRYPKGFSKDDVQYAELQPDDVIVLNYTSGTTSLTKGVLLMEKNIVGNIEFFKNKLNKYNERTLSILPNAHVYGLMFSVLSYLSYGGKVTFLGKIPSPAVLMSACAEVKPQVLTLVPLIFEKIYKMRIAPMLNKPMIKLITKIPFVKNIIYKKIGKKLYNQLGGDGLYQVIIGGAAINKDVEKFLRNIKFPFTVGYGMTECAPLISYIDHKDFVLESVGLGLGKPYAEVRVVKQNREDAYGEIQIFGSNVMKGYYKDEEATANTFTEDGWLKSGDLGYIDEKGNIYIKGRSKTMLLGSSGENIYPEAIESKIMNLPFIAECIVMQNVDNKLIAFIYPDYAMLESANVPKNMMDRVMANNRRTLNDQLARFEIIHRIEIISEPLPKTPKNTVKRYGLEYLLDIYEANKLLSVQKKRNDMKIEKEIKKKTDKSNKKAKNKLKKKNSRGNNRKK